MRNNLSKIIRSSLLSVFFFFIILAFGNIIDIKTADAKICRYTHYCSYAITKNGISYNVTGSATYSRTCGQNSFPSWGCEAVRIEILDRIGPSNLSATWNLSCGNTHRYVATIVPVNGSCGSANGGSSVSFPTANLCNAGTPSGQSSSPTAHNWTCSGIYGGTSATCSAPIPEDMAVSCVASPTTGVANSLVTFTAVITGTTTPPSAFVYEWKVNNVASTSVYEETFRKVWPNATNTPQVEVLVSNGFTTQKANCPFDRVDCSSNNYYCGDQNPVISYSCVPTVDLCVASASACGFSIDQEYDISKDAQLLPGGALATTSAAATDQYIIDYALCGAGNSLRYAGAVSSWTFTPGYNAWNWQCKHPAAAEYASCKAKCIDGEYYCMTAGVCVSNSIYCGCPDASSGLEIDQRYNCVNADGTCFGCSKVIEYFKLIPDEIQKNQVTNLCGGYWETNIMAPGQKPEGTAQTRVVCVMKEGVASSTVSANKPEGGAAHPLGIGTHTLTCTQQYLLTGGGGIWHDYQDESLDVKCRAVPSLIER